MHRLIPLFQFVSSFLLQIICCSWQLLVAIVGSGIIWVAQILISLTYQPKRLEPIKILISGFLHDVDEICALLGYYGA
jgi:hypothetical protein